MKTEHNIPKFMGCSKAEVPKEFILVSMHLKENNFKTNFTSQVTRKKTKKDKSQKEEITVKMNEIGTKKRKEKTNLN